MMFDLLTWSATERICTFLSGSMRILAVSPVILSAGGQA